MTIGSFEREVRTVLEVIALKIPSISSKNTEERLLTVEIATIENEEDGSGSLEDNIDSNTKEEADKTANNSGDDTKNSDNFDLKKKKDWRDRVQRRKKSSYGRQTISQ